MGKLVCAGGRVSYVDYIVVQMKDRPVSIKESTQGTPYGEFEQSTFTSLSYLPLSLAVIAYLRLGWG